MRTSDIGQVIFSLLRAAGRTDTVELTPGQIISVMLKEIRGNLALLTYQGKELLANLEADVPAGQRLKCLVEGEKDGRVVLRVLPEGTGSAGQEMTAGILKGMGLDTGKANIRLIGEMIKQEMPLAPETIRALSAFIRSAGIPEGDIWIPVFMQEKGIPLTPQMFTETRAMLTEMKYLLSETTRLMDGIRDIIKSAGAGSELGRVAADIYRVMESIQFRGTDDSSEMLRKLMRAFRLLDPGSGSPAAGQAGPAQGTTAQTGAAQSGPSQTGTAQAGTALAGTAQAGTAQAADSQPGAFRTDSTPVPASQSAGTGSEAIQATPARINPLPRDGDFIKIIIDRFAELMDKNGFPGDKAARDSVFSRIYEAAGEQEKYVPEKPEFPDLLHKFAGMLRESGGREPSDLAALVKNLADKMEFVRQFNTGTETSRENSVIVYSSVRYEDREEPLKLIITHRHDQKNKKRDFSSCRVEVKLETRSLGLVKCEVNVNDRCLTLGFITENERARILIDSSRDILAGRLMDMNYSVSMLDCRVDSGAAQEFMPGDRSDKGGFFHINLRV